MDILKHVSMVMVLAVGTVGLAQAHHSANSQFDTNRTLAFTGVLAKYTLANPHSYLYFVRMKNGKEEHWIFETIAPVALQRAGLSMRGTFKVGDTYTLAYSPALGDQTAGVMTAVKLLDGRIIGFSAQSNVVKSVAALTQKLLNGAQSSPQ